MHHKKQQQAPSIEDQQPLRAILKVAAAPIARALRYRYRSLLFLLLPLMFVFLDGPPIPDFIATMVDFPGETEERIEEKLEPISSLPDRAFARAENPPPAKSKQLVSDPPSSFKQLSAPARKPSPTPSPLPTLTPTPPPTSTPLPSPTLPPPPTWTPVPPPPSSTPIPIAPAVAHASMDQYRAWMAEARQLYPYPQSIDTMWAVMICESKGNSQIVHGPYHGLFQYSSQTWTGAWNPFHDQSILDPRAQIFATAKAWYDGYQHWWSGCLP